ncbi:MAG: isocitrate lyase/PEP mutase family protein [bacterium]
MERAKKYRKLLKRGKPMVIPAAHDALTARIIEMAGFELVGITGFGVSAAFLGRPDVGLMTQTELVQVTRHITRSVRVPVSVDADTGYGNAINVMRTVEELIQAGAAGIHIEDQVDPKRCGHVAGKRVIPVEEAVGKYKAADRVRKALNPDLVLVARTDVRGAPGGTIEDVIQRGNAYVDAGADMVHPEGVLTLDELRLCVERIPAPIVYNMVGVSPKASLSELEEIGVAFIADPIGAFLAAARAVYDYMKELRTGETDFMIRFSKSLQRHPIADVHAFVGFGEYRELEETFLPKEEVLQRYEQSVGYQPSKSGN